MKKRVFVCLLAALLCAGLAFAGGQGEPSRPITVTVPGSSPSNPATPPGAQQAPHRSQNQAPAPPANNTAPAQANSGYCVTLEIRNVQRFSASSNNSKIFRDYVLNSGDVGVNIEQMELEYYNSMSRGIAMVWHEDKNMFLGGFSEYVAGIMPYTQFHPNRMYLYYPSFQSIPELYITKAQKSKAQVDAEARARKFPATHTVIQNLALRQEPSISAAVIKTLAPGTRVQLLEKGRFVMVDGVSHQWAKVQTEAGDSGWCFMTGLQ